MIGWEDELSMVYVLKANTKRTVFIQHSVQVNLTILIYNLKTKIIP